MKMKQMILLAMSAVLGVFGVSHAMAETASEYVSGKIRIESITKVSADGKVNLPLSPETTPTVYFDVKLVDTTDKAEFLANGYNVTASNNHDRPYLVLDIPLRGESTKQKVTLASGEPETVTTATAVAYYVGQGASGDVLRFAYDVRPGDMTDALTWATKANGAPLFGGALAAIRLELDFILNNIPTFYQGGVVESVLQGEKEPKVSADNQLWPVGGYKMTIGALDDPTDLNKNALYQGLVPVTVSTKDGAPAATFADSNLAAECYFWVEALDADGTWKYAPAAVTLLRTEASTIMEADYVDTLSDTFNAAAYAKFAGPTDTSAAAFTPQTFFVNIPATIDEGTKVRLCYGVRNDSETASNLYTYIETVVKESPVITDDNTSGYEVSCGEMEIDEFELPVDALKSDYKDLEDKTVSGGIINAAAGEKITLVISKNNIDQLTNYGTLYASIELISTTNTARASFDRYYVPLNPTDLSGGHTATLTLGAQAKGGKTYYRIRIPQLEALGAEAVDKPFYLCIESSPKRETITLTPGATGTMGTEYYQPAEADSTAPGSVTFLEYTLSVPSSTSNRYFKIFPVAYDMETQITSTMTFADGRNVQEVLKRYVKLQNQAGAVLPGAGVELVVNVPAGATSATFYVACVNDYPMNANALTGDIYLNDTKTDHSLSGALFVAKSCTSSGSITGTNDICNGIVQPTVQNRAPTITSGNPPTSGATGTALTFSFQVVDTYSDYLVAQMSYGDGTVETWLYANEAEMIALMGADAWAAQLSKIASLYGGTAADYALNGARRKDRSALGSELMTFTHTYTTASNPTWNFAVTDSSMSMVTQSGQLTLQTSQLFTFYTVTNATVPATGFVRWGNQSVEPNATDLGWSFGETYTYNALTKSGGSTVVMAKAIPFPAGSATPAGYTDVNATHDSFFYKWTARHADYEPLLPTGGDLYENILSINRAFVSGGGEADDPAKWQDIVLGAIFVAEYIPSDALKSFSKNRTAAYVYDLGDYNRDGVPDGWLVRNLGEEAGRAAVEGGSQAATAPEGDTLPAAGWGSGDAAYRWQPAGTQLGYNLTGPGPCAEGQPFGYRERLRGRRLPGWPDALHAADGNGKWLSMAIWAVGVPSDAEDTDWRMIPLYDGSNPAAVTIERTEMGVPYTGTVTDGWAVVVDAGGNPINSTGAYAELYTIEVQTDDEAENYETFRCTPVGGAAVAVAGGMLLDEPFTGTDPRNFSWLDRFAPNNADVDGDGISNGMEYFFWYYASRMAWAPTLTDADGNVQIVKDAWPFIDPAKIAEPNTGDELVMGRKYLNSYNPDAPVASFYADRDNASAGKGNYWDPIPVGEVLAFFNPYAPGVGDDLDNDGLGTLEEIGNGTNPIDCDTDNDWMPDGWEVAFDLDPLNLNGVNDAELNDDGDFYALAEVPLYSDYHHLLPVTELTVRTLDGDILKEEVRPGYTTNAVGELYYYYDVIAESYATATVAPTNTLDQFDEEIMALTYVEPVMLEGLADDGTNTVTGLSFDNVTLNPEPRFLKKKPVIERLRDNAVYKAFGFSPLRAWSGNTNDTYTQPFASREEFNSAVKRAGRGAKILDIIAKSTNPTLADTNADGMPDGWSAYVGFDPLDNLAAAQDLDEDGLNGAAEYAMGVDGWTNKTYPTDPNNPDTDFDTVSDGAERAYLANGGMNPTVIDTDGDGMPDGWEYLYGGGATDDRGRPNPAMNHDGDLDYDRDGLTNYQEYLVGLMRHLRFDLGPDAARIYKDFPGEAAPDAINKENKNYVWTELPDAYAVTEDLANPVDTYSITYNAAVPVLAQAWAANNSLTAVDYQMALLSAFNRLWCTTIAFPTADQAADYGLYTNLKEDQNDPKIMFLQNAIVEFDAAYQRLLTANGDEAKLLILDRQIRALMMRIDRAIDELKEIAELQLQGTQDPLRPLREPVATLLKGGGDTEKIWDARKKQVAAAGKMMLDRTLLNFELPEGATFSPITDDSGTQTPTTVPSYPYYDLTYVRSEEPTDYEKAVYTAECPLLRTTYRAAVRGFNGGLQDGKYFGPLAQHAALLTFAKTVDANGKFDGGRCDNGDEAIFLGDPMDGDTLSALDMPIQGGRDEGVYFPTTNPLAADTDADGMDDYWEIFHGLNPILGDYANESSSAGSGNYIDDVITLAYPKFSAPTGPDTPFNAPTLQKGDVTGYDYYSYPWLAGAPFADPDGDGLLNFEEAVNPVASAPAHYGTDPSALWMTDPANENAFTTRFYGCMNLNYLKAADDAGKLAAIMPAPLVYTEAIKGEATPAAQVLPFEINEGYDTDGDGVGDLTELTSTTIYRGDPQSLRTPDRQQAAYFGGAGAMQSFGETQFGPTALTTFTLECWVKPDAKQDTEDVVLIDRPWRFTDAPVGDVGARNLRHNFVLGLQKAGDGTFLPYVKYTGAGTTYEASDDTPQASPIVTSGETIKAGEWNHIAATYDGKRLVIILNGTETGAAACSLIPANGVIALKNDGMDDYRRFTYRKAPILIGATPASEWFADLDGDELIEFNKVTAAGTYVAYDKCYKGFIDEVRIWNGARTASQIAEARRTGFTQAQLLDFRYKAFMARYEGNGYYQANTPAEPLAIYTFNDLLAGAKSEDEPWEAYPGEELMPQTEVEDAAGDTTLVEVPGSFRYRRKGLEASIKASDGKSAVQYKLITLPKVEEVYTSYYTLLAPAKLRSKFYCENSKAVAAGTDSPITEYVPLAHNTITHLPVADVERVVDEDELINCLLKPSDQDEGSPKLRFPSGSPENLKPLDSVYWTAHAAGYDVKSGETYAVKTTGNPYAYYYGSTYTFDMVNYRVYPAYSLRTGTDLLIYGDVFAKYDTESWDNSPSTDPSAGKTDSAVNEGTGWFEYAEGAGTDYDDIQNSAGGQWLKDKVALGQTKDTDGDRMPNWWENYYALDPEDPTGDNGPHGDADGDYLTNYAEFLAKANPGKYSTVGNGVPDSQIPIWFRRGRPTFALLYTDNDMMEDHWEAANRSDRLTVDLNDAAGDADGDGWSNFAEARAGFRGSKHSTNPNAATSFAQTGATVLEMPTPAIRLTVDYFGDQNVYTNATDAAKIVVHAYTAKNNNSAPDAVFTLPLATATTAEEAQEYTQDIGNWHRGTVSGYLHLGNIIPGSMRIRFARQLTEGEENVDENDYLYFDIVADTANGSEAALYYNHKVTVTEEQEDGTETTSAEIVRVPAGKVNYTTGYYELDFSDENLWPSFWRYTSDDGVNSYYDATENTGTVTYRSAVVAGKSNTFTLVNPASGYLKEGKNNFFVFADLNGNGTWQDGEPAGIPDQHDVEIGFDLVNKPLHVALTEMAPPGAVRLDVKSILDQVMTLRPVETEGNDYEAVLASDSDDDEDGDSSVINPSTGKYLKRSDFLAIMDYELVLVCESTIGAGNDNTENPPVPAYRKLYNTKKPYLTEDEIFSQLPTGLPGTHSSTVRAASYKVYYIPTTLSAKGINSWKNYNIAIVTNKLEMLDGDSTKLVSPIGGALRYNTDLAFEWLCNVQVPSFTLTITKKADGSGAATDTVVYKKTARGVTPIATALGNGAVEQFRYRYTLPRGIGELSPEGSTVFGNGTYSYTLSLEPYNGSAYPLTGEFRIQLADSGDADLIEKGGAEQDTSYNAQDTNYARTRVWYNGVLAENADFGGRRVVIEAHYSASFNGDPIAATSDFLVYDTRDADGKYDDASGEVNAINRCVRMVKDKVYGKEINGEKTDCFFATRFDAELRGLPTTDPVYLTAYFDLNGNGKRDTWEPWGYATMGLDSPAGFYYDPRSVKPVSTGKDFLVEFYIQDVDTDNDKLADSWEWLQAGQPTTDFDSWCGKLGASIADHRGTSIWIPGTTNGISLTAYGAQLYGLTVEGVDANGAVKVENFPEDVALGIELYNILGADVAQQLFDAGYLSYGLSVASITCDGDAVTLDWDVTTATGVADGAAYDLTDVLANTNTEAVYAVYGKASIADTEWTRLSTVNVSGASDPSLTIPLTEAVINGKPAAFFKVILSAKTAEATLAD